MAKSKKNKSPGAQIVFDEDERKKYLLGFRKRKIQRREKAKEELEERIRQEKKKQRELKTQAIMDERKKAGLPVFGGDKLVLKTKNVIETDQNEIIISDFSSSLGTKQVKLDDDEDEDDDFEKRDWENQSLLHKSVVADSEMMKSKAKLSKESTAISERLTKLEKQKKSLETSNTKKKKNYLKSKKTAKKSRAARKYLSKDAKIKLKNRINKAKKAK